jgi:outer membrane PBP1 activator LpoA protein
MMRWSIHRLVAVLVLTPAILYGALTVIATEVACAAAATHVPHIALILPLNSPSFGQHADAVRQGFVAAAKVAGRDAPAIRIYPVNEDTINLLTMYEQAVESGAQVVIGPLTRTGVATLAASNVVTVPTLALNVLEARSQQPSRMYLFGLSIEFEARQVAQIAFKDGRRKAYVINDDSTLSKRMRQAFMEEFARLGGMTIGEFSHGTDQSTLARIRDAAALGVADMSFLALDAAHAGTVRPYLGKSLAIYATSHVNGGKGTPKGPELNGVHFLDMPWMLLADHPAVMIYPRPQFGDAVDFDRLYALGIDAFRIGLELLRPNSSPVLDGVTGRLRLTRDQQFVRELTPAQFVDGKTVVSGSGRR